MRINIKWQTNQTHYIYYIVPKIISPKELRARPEQDPRKDAQKKLIRARSAQNVCAQGRMFVQGLRKACARCGATSSNPRKVHSKMSSRKVCKHKAAQMRKVRFFETTCSLRPELKNQRSVFFLNSSMLARAQIEKPKIRSFEIPACSRRPRKQPKVHLFERICAEIPCAQGPGASAQSPRKVARKIKQT